MANEPFVSVRKYIKWGDNPAGENTNTHVLTTAAKYFVDIRIFLPTAPSQPSLPTSTSLPPSRLEWAFAGTASSTPATYSSIAGKETEISKPAHTIWTHWVDSQTTEEVKDEGDMYIQPNGEVLEYGTMVNPATGKEERYEECWVDLEIKVVGEERERRSWCLRVEDEEKEIKGCVIRIGGYISGVLRRGEDVVCARWLWSEVGGWGTFVKVGELSVPEDVFGEGEIEEGRVLESGDGLKWTCVESYNWT